MNRSSSSRIETISAGALSQKIEDACSKQQYWVTGECKDAWKSAKNVWNFDLVTKESRRGQGEEIFIVPCRIWDEKESFNAGKTVVNSWTHTRTAGNKTRSLFVWSDTLEVEGINRSYTVIVIVMLNALYVLDHTSLGAVKNSVRVAV